MFNKFLLCLVVLSTASAEIIKVKNISETRPELANVKKDSLVAFDVDYTIQAPKTLFLRPKGKKAVLSIFREVAKPLDAKQKTIFKSKLALHGEHELVEPEVKQIIDDLKCRKVPVIALTAIGSQAFGVVQDPMSLREKHLKELGISFESKCGRQTWADDSGYSAGIVFSGSQPKGKALGHYLEKIANFKPSKVIMLDDKRSYLESVEEYCTEQGIEFIGFHYVAEVFDNDPEVDVESAKLEIQALAK